MTFSYAFRYVHIGQVRMWPEGGHQGLCCCFPPLHTICWRLLEKTSVILVSTWTNWRNHTFYCKHTRIPIHTVPIDCFFFLFFNNAVEVQQNFPSLSANSWRALSKCSTEQCNDKTPHTKYGSNLFCLLTVVV